MLEIQAEEGEGSGHPSEPQPPPFTTQPINEEPIPHITSVHIPNVADEAVYEEWDDKVERDDTTTASLDAEQASDNITRTQSTTIPNVPFPQGIGVGGSPRCQEAIRGSIAQTRSERVPTMSYDSSLLRVITLGSDEGSMTLHELTVLFSAQREAHTQQDQPKDHLRVLSAAKVLAEAARKRRAVVNVHSYTRRRRAVSTVSGEISTANRMNNIVEESVSVAGVSMPVSNAGMVQEVSIPSPVTIKDKDSLDEELAQKLHEEEQAKFNAEQETKFHAEQEELLETTEDEANPSVADVDWDDVQAHIQADEGYKMEHFKGTSFNEVKEMFDKVYKQVTSFVPLDSEPTGESKADELSQEELKQMMIIVPEKGMNVEALQFKYPIIDWEIYTKDTRKYWKIIRVGNHTKVELKRLFEHDADDELWKKLKYVHDITWRLYDSCGVYHVFTKSRIDIYMLMEKEYPLSRGVLTQMLAAKLMLDQYSKMARELL
ncbi:hypothetical protein Tco_1283495 [Tanacetum coccineum]